jgi:hypothetical protein
MGPTQTLPGKNAMGEEEIGSMFVCGGPLCGFAFLVVSSRLSFTSPSSFVCQRYLAGSHGRPALSEHPVLSALFF